MSLNIINYPLKKNRCYQQNVKREPIGIQIHSIGCAQGTGKAVADSFNSNTRGAFVTYVCDADVTGRVYKCGPEDIYTWADAGYGNRNLITIEIAESDYMKYKPNSAEYTITDSAKFEADILRGYDTAVLLCAEICKRRNWDPYKKLDHGLYLISSHDEGRIAGVSSRHVDPTHIWSKFGLSMSTFRRAVKASIDGLVPSIQMDDAIKYRVRKTWTDAASQTGAFEKLELAKKEADRHPGYSVYDEEGKAVYTSVWYNVGIPSSKKAFIEAVAEAAKKLYSTTKILPSVVIGQCCLETGYGLGSDSTALVKVNNLLGMKKDLINNTWKEFSVWNGKSIKKLTPEEVNGKVIKKYDYFRVYDNYEQCITDYEMFLLNVKNNAGYKYRSVAGKTDPNEVIAIISKGGYATDSKYISKVMKVINENDLTKYDKEVIPTATTPTKIKDKYVVRRKLAEKKYELGRYSNLKEAKKIANLNWGYRVYDLETRKAVYIPKITIKQMFIAKMIQFDLYVRDDNAAGKQWCYFNSKPSKGSFWETRRANMRWTNCCGAVQLALYAAGVPKKALCWYFGKNKIVWLNDHAKKDFLEYFDIIKLREKTLKEYIDDGTVQPGDILGYVGFSHTNAYLMPGFTFDGGHLWCEGKGEGAKYTKWVGPLAYGNRKPAYAFRLKK
jgi:flagellum-specific peptidoglycan hydrolase FlgJ